MRLNYKKIILPILSALSCGIFVSSTIATVSLSSQENNNQLYNQEKLLINSNDEVKNYFIDKNKSNFIKGEQIEGKLNVNVDSYQQHNKLSYTKPKLTYSFEYNTVAEVKNVLYVDKTKFFRYLNDSSINKWSYNVSSWNAIAGKRYMGNVIIVPMYAQKVETYHQEKIITSLDNSTFHDMFNFIVDLFDSKIKPILLNDPTFSKLKKIIEITSQFLNNYTNTTFSNELKPIAKPDDLDFEINYVDFGNIKAKIVNLDKLNFKSNNLIPISYFKEDKNCSGPSCSHNIRHLVDVIITSVKDVVLNNYGDMNSFFGFLLTTIINIILKLIIKTNNSQIQFHNSKLIYKLIKKIWNLFLWNDIINDITKYLNSNFKNIIFNFFGKVEKHGIQLGKCGNLISGINIKSDENVATIYLNNKPLILYSGNMKSLFNSENTYDYNTLSCIVELANYKKLYLYIKDNNKIPDSIKEILLFNIEKTSVPSKNIFESLINYQKHGIIPKKFTLALKSFQKFKKSGWKIPKKIDYWDVLFENIVPSYLSKTLYTLNQNNEKNIFYSNFEFDINNKLYANDIYSTDYDSEIIRFGKEND